MKEQRRGLRQPVFVAGSAFLLGALLAPAAQPLGVALLGALMGLLAFRIWRRARIVPPLTFSLAFGAAGLLAAHLRLPDPAPLRGLADAEAGRAVELRAELVEELERGVAGATAVALVTHTRSTGEHVSGRARLVFFGPFPDFEVGDQLHLFAYLSLPESASMPVFRTPALAVQRGAAVSAGVVPGSWTKVGESWWAPLRQPRRWLTGRLLSAHAGELAALLFGDRRWLPAAMDSSLSQGGQSYLLALFGANALAIFGLAWMLARTVAKRLLRRPLTRPFALFLAVPIGCGVCLAFGPSPSILRALATGGVFLATWARRGTVEPPRALAWSVIAVVGVDPTSVGDVSFQLAFAGLAATFGAYRTHVGLAWQKWPRGSWSLAPLLLGLSLALGTLPLISRQFERVSAASLLANAFALPVEVLVLAPLSALAALLPAVAPLAQGSLEGLVRAAELAGAIGGRFPTPTVLECVLLYGAIAAVTARPATRCNLTLAVLFSGSLAASVASWRLSSLSSAELVVSVLPVPAGLSLVVEAPEGRTLVVGLGGPGGDPEVSLRMVMNRLKTRRIDRLSALVLPRADERDLDRARALGREVEIEALWLEPSAHALGDLDVHLFSRSSTSAGAIVALHHQGRAVTVGHGRPPEELEGAVWIAGSTVSVDGRVFDTRKDGMLTLRLSAAGVEAEAFRRPKP